MDLLTIIAIAVGLSFDTFAISISYGVMQNKISFREALRIASVLALSQGGLTVIGYFLGFLVSRELNAIDHWIALLLLLFLGIKMIAEGLKRGVDTVPRDYTKTSTLIAIAVSTSIDAFAVGLSFALLNINIWIPGIIIAFVTLIASMTAIRIGKSAGNHLGQRVEIIGGIILISIGIKIFLEHIL